MPIWRARRADGCCLRIEDIDATRCRPEYEAAIYEDLAWLGLAWEQPVRRQSEHFDDYRAALAKLEAMGLVYPSFESRAEIAALVADARSECPWPRDPDGAPLYPGDAKAMPPAERARRIASGEPYALRLDMAGRAGAGRPLHWSETGHGPAGETGDDRRQSRGLGRRDPGAQGNADQLSPVGRGRRRRCRA